MKPPSIPSTLLIFHLRPARIRARDAAVTEALRLLRPWQATAPPGGPLSEKGGVFWIALPELYVEKAVSRLAWLGYTTAVDRLEPAAAGRSRRSKGAQADGKPALKWKGNLYRATRIYEEDAETFRENAPDRRSFLLETGNGQVRAVQGYRGDGGPFSRRALPVCDARLLVNLVHRQNMASLLDPFAGGGGIVREALLHSLAVFSADIDPVLRHGLSQMGAAHCIADARRLPFASESIEAVATEPPYHQDAWQAVEESLAELRRILKPEGRVAVLCALGQAEGLRQAGQSLNLTRIHDFTIERKGTDCAALVWEKG